MDGTSRGEVSTEFSVIAGVLFLVAFFAVGAASFWSASHVASVGAFEAARAAAVQRDDRSAFEAGAEWAERAVEEMGSRMTRPPGVAVDAERVSVRVSVRVTSPLGLFPGSVTRVASVPRERYVAEEDR